MEKDHTTNGTNEFPATGIMKTSEVIVTRTEEAAVSSRPNSGHMHKKPSFSNTPKSQGHRAQSKVYRPSGSIDPNKAALKYCKCAMLFFLALIVTWVPSTVNRIYNIVRPEDVVFGLNLAAALVLPLQGFWNAIVYTVTSTYAVKCLWIDVKDVLKNLTS